MKGFEKLTTPEEIWNAVSKEQQKGRMLVIGKMNLVPPNSQRVFSKSKKRKSFVEYVPPQYIDIPNKGPFLPWHPGFGAHSFLNKYFYKSMESKSTWQYFGESNQLIEFFPIELPDLDKGDYLIKGIVIGEINVDKDMYLFVAQDAYSIEVVD